MTECVETDVAVIGGGVTGVGVLRDLALRGIRAVLIEKGDLGHGTSTRNHGLLHSGCRYAVRDPEAAIESYHENLILKRIVPGSIERTDGLFVKLPEDTDSYAEKWLASCKNLGIPVTEVALEQAFKEEPFLNRKAQAVFVVPDGAIDDFTLLIDTAEDAKRHGAHVLTYHEVTDLMIDQGRVSGLICSDTTSGKQTEIHAPIVVNAAGPWEGKIAKLAGIHFEIINNKGMLVVFSHRFNKHVINRLRMPSDGDIFVPAHDVTIFGTTGKNVRDPEDFSLNRAELDDMLAQGRALIPTIREMRLIRAYAGSRPLYQAHAASGSSGRDVTRGMALIDHEARDGIAGLISITGGKLTTFRLMAEKTVDLICEKMGINVACTTDQIPLPDRRSEAFLRQEQLAPAAKNKLFHWAGTHTAEIKTRLKATQAGQVLCECEQVTWAEIEAAIPKQGPFNLGDIRRRTRLGMGPCQGTFCQFRAAALAGEKGVTSCHEADQAICRSIRERQKGMAIVATGETAKQLQLMDAIYKVSLGFQKEEKAHV
ncbi:anaerobic glycerol-3-phosphate dehydrogenase subunit GlpA [Sporolactobacillus spathodeae]|uniref:Aerobic glycerol-3-phosphate dehydrogenase n=1 Tax=Sporolactobacillus spathodeae TaxID=1465502 RepID=A0ABS2Q5W7_9BACL|nr:anaerobic glycerol-3-phosphate dehydrogenase subunit GlpA [Sporolactobacillus spathodeae]MBM7657172.1 glycerol-3-phosphate dehydrogenase [Sporolactobacillus spathodeae]